MKAKVELRVNGVVRRTWKKGTWVRGYALGPGVNRLIRIASDGTRTTLRVEHAPFGGMADLPDELQVLA